jgi:hypothetical protein
VFFLQYNPYISLRLIDLGMAIVMAFLWYKVLARICNNNTGAAIIAFIFTFTLSYHVFIDSGFKNSITVAFVPLLLALYIGIGAVQEKKSGNAWWMAGALTALSVVFRETFAPFALFGLVSVFIAQGRKAALQFFVGGMAAGIVLIGGILLARGGIAETIAHYRAAGILFGSIPGEVRLRNFTEYGLKAFHYSYIVLAASALAVVVLSVAIFLQRSKSLLMATVFWLSFIGVALIESATKICFAYHFAIAFPGLAGLCALALREIIRIWPAMKWLNRKINRIFAVGGILLSAFWFYFSCSAMAIFYWPYTLDVLSAAPGGEWPEKFTDLSNHLFIAAEIKKVIPENGTLLVTMGMHGLYPLTGHLPPGRRLNDLGVADILLDSSVPAIQEVLLDCAPDVLMLATMRGWHPGSGSENLLEAVLATGIYEAVAEIPVSLRIYGEFAAMIFRKTRDTVCHEKQGMADWIGRDAASLDVTEQVLR